LGKDDADEHNVCVVSRKNGTGIHSVGKQLIVHEESDEDSNNLVDDVSVKSTALTKHIARKPHMRKDLGTKITTRSDSRCIYEKKIWNDPAAEDLVDTEEEDSSEEDEEGQVCAECAHNERHTKVSLMDELIMATLHLEKSEYNSTIHQYKDFPATVRDVFEINSWLCGIKYLKRNFDFKTYSGKDEGGKERILAKDLVEE